MGGWFRRVGSGMVAMLVVLAVALAIAGSASAEIYTLGTPVIETSGTSIASSEPATWFNTSLAAPGARLVSPIDGILVRWRISTGFSEGMPYRLQVLRLDSSGTYVAIRSTAGQKRVKPAEPPAKPEHPEEEAGVFRSRIHIEAGDMIAIASTKAGARIGVNSGSDPANAVATIAPALVDGAPSPAVLTGDEYELGFNADVTRPPTVGGISTTGGPFSGGGEMVIEGDEFTGTESVMVGPNAAVFSVESDDRIAATVPASRLLGPFPVSVTTAAGGAVAPLLYDYEGCRVPKLTQLKPENARKRIVRAGCAVAGVRRAQVKGRRTGLVVKQKPGAGKLLKRGAKVSFAVG